MSSRTPQSAPSPCPQVLLVDDDSSFLEVMRFHLQDEGFEADTAPDGEVALRMYESSHYPLVVTDLKMPKLGGLELLRAIKQMSPDTLLVVITAFGDMATAVEAMKAGAFDFLPKPCDRDHFKLTVRRALEHIALKNQVRDLRSQLDSTTKPLVFRSPAMTKLVSLADRVADSDATVLILGESGTGKELIARRIHRKSPRINGPFVPINCAAIPRELLESELFGHVRGAFTGAVKDRKGRFEQANQGTLFLDEVGELPLDIQVRLLRVLQERVVDVVGKNEPTPVNVRIIAATNRDLRKAVDSGAFREDLFFRLAVFPIQVPPLRERSDDIEPLVRHFVRQYGGDRSFVLSEALLKKLKTLEWRGNVRELENACQRMVLLAEDENLTPELVPPSLLSMAESSPPPGTSTIQLPPEGISLIDLERDVIIRALEMNHYNQTHTAKFLRIPRHILQYRIEKYQIPLKGRS